MGLFGKVLGEQNKEKLQKEKEEERRRHREEEEKLKFAMKRLEEEKMKAKKELLTMRKKLETITLILGAHMRRGFPDMLSSLEDGLPQISLTVS